MNIKLFKARLHRWLYRSERLRREAWECNKCCLTCRRYFDCVAADKPPSNWEKILREIGESFGEWARNFDTVFNTAAANASQVLSKERIQDFGSVIHVEGEAFQNFGTVITDITEKPNDE